MAKNPPSGSILLKNNFKLLQTNRLNRLLFLSTLDETGFATLAAADKNNYGLAEMKFSEVLANAEEKLAEMDLVVTKEEAITAIAPYCADAAINEWKNTCKLATTVKDLFVILRGAPNGLEYTAILLWIPPAELEGKRMVLVQQRIDGGTFTAPAAAEIATGEFNLQINRATNKIAIRGSIKYRAEDNREFTAQFFVPALYDEGEEENAEDPWYLSDYPERIVFGSVNNVDGSLTMNRVWWQDKIEISDRLFDKAIGMKPTENSIASAEWRIPKGFKWFVTIFAFAKPYPDQTTTTYTTIEVPTIVGGGLIPKIKINKIQVPHSVVTTAKVSGTIFIDGVKKWKGELSPSAPICLVPPIEIGNGAKIIRLEVDSLGTNWSDNATWAEPVFSNVHS